MDSVNRLLRLNSQRGERRDAMKITAKMLPEWIEVGNRLLYASKSNPSNSQHVKVTKIEEARQAVLVVFEVNKKIWKRVPFAEISKFGDGSLRPLWKKSEAEQPMLSCPERPQGDELEDPEEPAEPAEGEEVAGPQGPPAAGGADSPPPAEPAAASLTISADDSDEERKEQMERRMRRMKKVQERAKSRSRSPKGKSAIYVPGHF